MVTEMPKFMEFSTPFIIGLLISLILYLIKLSVYSFFSSFYYVSFWWRILLTFFFINFDIKLSYDEFCIN